MKIDEIIKKSIEVPGISIKRSEYSAELILKEKDGKGSMTFFPLFPGLTLAYIFINSPTWAAPDFRDNGSIETGPLLLNYCVTGRCELILNNGNFVYVKDGEISLTERFARQQYVYPRRIYEGMEFFIDMDAAAEQSTWIQTEFDIDFHKIRELYCPAGSTYISAISPEIEEILKKTVVLVGYLCAAFHYANENLYPGAFFAAPESERNTAFSSLHILHRNTGRYCKACGKNHHF